MPITDLADDILSISSRFDRKEYSAVDLTSYCLDEIERVDTALHSFVLVLKDRALADARRADDERAASRRRGPLHGIPFAVKDVFDAEEVVTTGGSPAFRNKVASRDATAIARLRAAGAIFLGKLATHELTHGGVDFGLPWPPALNPWNLEYDPGGSSSGPGSAVAAGLCQFALGTDTGGSIRKPAGMCGIAGLKPTFGRVSRFGVMLNASSLDHCGVLARTSADCALVLQAIAGHDALDPVTSSEGVPDYAGSLNRNVRGLRVGVISHFWTEDSPVGSAVREGMQSAIAVLERLGAKIGEVRLTPLADFNEVKLNLQRPELFAEYGNDIRSRRHEFGPNMQHRLDKYDQVSPEEYRAAKKEQVRLTELTLRQIAEFDVLVTVGPGPAIKIKDVAGGVANRPDVTLPFNITGLPVVTACIGFEHGLPFSMQIAGKPFDEATVLRVADAFEKATPWHRRRPEMKSKVYETAVL